MDWNRDVKLSAGHPHNLQWGNTEGQKVYHCHKRSWNKIGPRILPCGTPVSTGIVSENLEFMRTAYHLLAKWLVSQATQEGEAPVSWSVSIKMPWLSVCKALLMSSNTTAVIFFFRARIKSVVRINDVSVYYNLLLPLCFVDNLSFDTKYGMSW